MRMLHTPFHIFQEAQATLSNTKGWVFLCDVAADANNSLCLDYYCEEENGLEQEWRTANWCNPPYDQKAMKLFLQKACDERDSERRITALLLPMAPDTKLFTMCCREGLVEPYSGRVDFIDPETGEPARPTAVRHSMLVWVGLFAHTGIGYRRSAKTGKYLTYGAHG
jgi:phage N-6-adenine-methyltransferase